MRLQVCTVMSGFFYEDSGGLNLGLHACKIVPYQPPQLLFIYLFSKCDFSGSLTMERYNSAICLLKLRFDVTSLSSLLPFRRGKGMGLPTLESPGCPSLKQAPAPPRYLSSLCIVMASVLFSSSIILQPEGCMGKVPVEDGRCWP